MSGPPKGEEPSELWLALEKRPRPSTLIDFPCAAGETSPGKLALVVLTESERHQARANAGAVARELVKGSDRERQDAGLLSDASYLDIYNSELSVQLVVQACRNPKDIRFPAFPSPRHARQALTTDDFGLLAQSYEQFRLSRGPYLSEMTHAEFEAWLKVLQEGASRVPLAQLSGEALKDLVMFLVSKIRAMGTSSATSQPDGSSPEFTPPSVSALIDDAERPTPES